MQGAPALTIEGAFVGATTTSVDLKDNSHLVVPATADAALVIPTDMIVNTGVKVKVEDIPNAPVDLTLAGTISYGWHPRDAIHKTGTGVLRLTGKNTYGGGELDSGNGTTKVLEGRLLVDNTQGSGTGNGPVTVAGDAILGGTGLIGGQTTPIIHWSKNNCDGSQNVHVTPKGSADKQAVIWPGTIDAETGAHVNGTLTVGTVDLHNPVHFGDYSTLKIGFGEGKNQYDALVVNGAVDISATGTKIELVASDASGKVRGGTYTILSATDGITGDFAQVDAQYKGWKVNKVMGKVTTEEGEADAVVALTATIPGSFMVIIR